ncbi:MAG TPA: hypothetical protein VK438_01425 [Xanthobacteraceae bacterium]|nr:hypothetical protein [Xanthobacteraceae bacterium]
MSDPKLPPQGRIPGPQGLGVFLTVLFVLVGIVLLLPGLCSLVFMVGMGSGGGPLVLLWLLTFGIAAGGVVLIRYAIRNR